MTDQRKDLPPANSPQFLERVREAMSTYLGNRGDQLDRGVTLRDLYESGIVSLSGSSLTGSGKASIAGIGTKVAPKTAVDLTPPPTPTGFIASAAITTIFIGCDAQLYQQGHGHDRTVVYGATYTTGPVPVFSDAIKITEFVGTVFGHPSNPATKWRLWIKWQSIDGVLSVVPAGGTNGLEAITGQDVQLLLDALTGQIKDTQLFKDLGDRIKLIDGDTLLVGSVNSRLLTQANKQANDLLDEVASRTTGLANEALARQTLTNRTTVSEAAIVATSAAVTTLTGRVTNTEGTVTGLAAAQQSLTTRVTSTEGRVTATSDAVTILANRVTNTETGITGQSVAQQALTTRVTSAEGQITATSGALTTLQSTVGLNTSAITAEATTRANADSAISSSVTTLGSRVNNIDGSIAGQAAAQQSLDTRVTTAEGRITSASDAVTILANRATNIETGVSGQAAAQQQLSSRVTSAEGTITSTASSVTTLQATVGSNTSAIAIETNTRANQAGELYAQYTVKIDQNGYVSGFGFASSANNSTPASAFSVRADRFYIANPSGPGVAPSMPFIVQTTPTTINDVYVPTGVYIQDGFIANGTITNAKIGNAAIDDAKVANLSASKLTAGQISVGAFINSSNYISGVQGWSINGNGGAEFSSVVVRGTVYASAGTFAGSLSAATGTFSGTLTANAINAVGTINIADNAVTVATSGKGRYFAEAVVNFTSVTKVHLTATWVQGTGRNSLFVRLKHNGNWVSSQSPIEGTIGTLTAEVMSNGPTTFRIEADDYIGEMDCSILVMGVRK